MDCDFDNGYNTPYRAVEKAVRIKHMLKQQSRDNSIQPLAVMHLRTYTHLLFPRSNVSPTLAWPPSKFQQASTSLYLVP